MHRMKQSASVPRMPIQAFVHHVHRMHHQWIYHRNLPQHGRSKLTNNGGIIQEHDRVHPHHQRRQAWMYPRGINVPRRDRDVYGQMLSWQAH